MTLRGALALFARPWIDGSVTFQDWLLACAVIEAAIARDEAAAGIAPPALNENSKETTR